MISNKELFLRSYKKQQNQNPDIYLPPSTTKKTLKKIKVHKPRKIKINTRYGEMSISN